MSLTILGDDPQAAEAEFSMLLVASLDDVRRNARRFVRSAAEVDDLTQTVLLKAWRSRAQYAPGTNLLGWLYVILRNSARSGQRSMRREQSWDDAFAHLLVVEPSQGWSCEMIDLQRGLTLLPGPQRKALLSIVIEGGAIAKVARTEGVSVRAMKSRLHRARSNLARTSMTGQSLARTSSERTLRGQEVVRSLKGGLQRSGVGDVDRQQAAILRAFLDRKRSAEGAAREGTVDL